MLYNWLLLPFLHFILYVFLPSSALLLSLTSKTSRWRISSLSVWRVPVYVFSVPQSWLSVYLPQQSVYPQTAILRRAGGLQGWVRWTLRLYWTVPSQRASVWVSYPSMHSLKQIRIMILPAWTEMKTDNWCILVICIIISYECTSIIGICKMLPIKWYSFMLTTTK